MVSNGVGRAATFGTSFGVVGLNQNDQRLPEHNCLHQAQKTLPLGALPRGGLLVITESELLAAHHITPVRACEYMGIFAWMDSVFQSRPNNAQANRILHEFDLLAAADPG